MKNENQDILKVLKLNQDKSEALLERAKCFHSQMKADNIECDISDHLAGLPNIDSSKDARVLMPGKIGQSAFVPYKSFDELLREANEVYPDEITIRDILSSEEIESARRHVDDIYKEFNKRTGLKHIDIVFLSVAVGLQVLRQYVLDPWLRSRRPKADSNDEKGRKKNAGPGWYHADTDKILISKVPFDTAKYGDYSTVQGLLKGAKNHRLVTLGHDPLLGWLFGTMNILTNTITVSGLKTAHVKQQKNQNVIYAMADTYKAGQASIHRLINEGLDGKKAVGCAVLREAIHLKSDINTPMSLPIPIVSSVSPKLASQLASYGIDTASVGTEMTLSLVINVLISMVHGLFFDESEDDKRLYKVRTRKILLYSNSIASTSNIIVSAVKKDPKVLDVGGLIVTISRLFSDIEFITQVGKEFVDNQIADDFHGTLDELDLMYNNKFTVPLI